MNEKLKPPYTAFLADRTSLLLLEPLLEYITELARQRQPSETMTIVAPEFISKRRITSALHMNTAELLRSQPKGRLGIVTIRVPYQIHEAGDDE